MSATAVMPPPHKVKLLPVPPLESGDRLSRSELVVEIAASTASIDLHEKKHVYWRNGVQEYIVWQIYDGRITWFVLGEGEYKEITADEQGIIRSRSFPGLWLAVEEMLGGI
jgi:Uma2 family endonuclease